MTTQLFPAPSEPMALSPLQGQNWPRHDIVMNANVCKYTFEERSDCEYEVWLQMPISQSKRFDYHIRLINNYVDPSTFKPVENYEGWLIIQNGNLAQAKFYRADWQHDSDFEVRRVDGIEPGRMCFYVRRTAT